MKRALMVRVAMSIFVLSNFFAYSMNESARSSSTISTSAPIAIPAPRKPRANASDAKLSEERRREQSRRERNKEAVAQFLKNLEHYAGQQSQTHGGVPHSLLMHNVRFADPAAHDTDSFGS